MHGVKSHRGLIFGECLVADSSADRVWLGTKRRHSTLYGQLLD
jgi:hypothetical protein